MSSFFSVPISPVSTTTPLVAMAATNEPKPKPTSVPPTPHPPSPIEAELFYYGIPSRPRLVARSSSDVWAKPTGLEAYALPKESSPAGLHPLGEILEAQVGPAMVKYLDSKG